MIQLRGYPCLAYQPLSRRVVSSGGVGKDLDCDVAPEVPIGGAIHLTHTAGPRRPAISYDAIRVPGARAMTGLAVLSTSRETAQKTSWENPTSMICARTANPHALTAVRDTSSAEKRPCSRSSCSHLRTQVTRCRESTSPRCRDTAAKDSGRQVQSFRRPFLELHVRLSRKIPPVALVSGRPILQDGLSVIGGRARCRCRRPHGPDI